MVSELASSVEDSFTAVNLPYKEDAQRACYSLDFLASSRGNPHVASFGCEVGLELVWGQEYSLASALQVGADFAMKPHGSEKAEEWQRECKTLASSLRTKSGIEIGPSKVLLHVLPVEGLVRQLDNSVEKQFAPKALLQPLQVRLTILKDATSCLRQFPKGCHAIWPRLN